LLPQALGWDASFQYDEIPSPITGLQPTDKVPPDRSAQDPFPMAKVGKRAGADPGWIWPAAAAVMCDCGRAAETLSAVATLCSVVSLAAQSLACEWCAEDNV